MEREYTKQDVFRHKKSRKVLVYNCIDGIDYHQFVTQLGTFRYAMDDVEYLGRNTQILLYTDAVERKCYYIYGGNNLSNNNQLFQLVKIDEEDYCQHFKMKPLSQSDADAHWVRTISYIPFDELEDNLFNPFDYPNVVSVNGNTELLPIPEDLNKTILVKQPRALI